MKITPKQLYERLNNDFRITEQTGNIQFNLGDVSIIVKRRDVVGNIMQEWLEGWLKKNNIEYSANPNTQMPPDLYLDPEDLTHNLLEVKAFNYEATPAFDIAEPEAYLQELERHPYMLNSYYIIFGYVMNEDTGIVTIKDMWLKYVWEITAPAKKTAMTVGGSAHKMRPTKWYNRTRRSKKLFESKEDYLSAFIELLYKQHHKVAEGSKDKIIASYKKFYKETIRIQWWDEIKTKYFEE